MAPIERTGVGMTFTLASRKESTMNQTTNQAAEDEGRTAGWVLASAIAICELIMLTLVICVASGIGPLAT